MQIVQLDISRKKEIPAIQVEQGDAGQGLQHKYNQKECSSPVNQNEDALEIQREYFEASVSSLVKTIRKIPVLMDKILAETNEKKKQQGGAK